jgi:hypothetical protein
VWPGPVAVEGASASSARNACSSNEVAALRRLVRRAAGCGRTKNRADEVSARGECELRTARSTLIRGLAALIRASAVPVAEPLLRPAATTASATCSAISTPLDGELLVGSVAPRGTITSAALNLMSRASLAAGPGRHSSTIPAGRRGSTRTRPAIAVCSEGEPWLRHLYREASARKLERRVGQPRRVVTFDRAVPAFPFGASRLWRPKAEARHSRP